VSYETIKSTSAFDTVDRNAAYVYDNSGALIALLGQGDAARAQSIANALIYAQETTGSFTDGRLERIPEVGTCLAARVGA